MVKQLPIRIEFKFKHDILHHKLLLLKKQSKFFSIKIGIFPISTCIYKALGL